MNAKNMWMNIKKGKQCVYFLLQYLKNIDIDFKNWRGFIKGLIYKNFNKFEAS